MRRAVLLLPVLLLAACSSPCEDLGNKFCSCYSGTSRDTCEKQVSKTVDQANPSGSEEDFCKAKLDTCHAPSGADFCEWFATAEGKEACGLSYPATTTDTTSSSNTNTTDTTAP